MKINVEKTKMIRINNSEKTINYSKQRKNNTKMNKRTEGVEIKTNTS